MNFRHLVLQQDFDIQSPSGSFQRPHEAGAVRAVALTAFVRLEDRTRAMLSGYQMHLAKPVDARELIVTVASLASK